MSITIQKKLKNLDLPRSEKQVAVAMAGHLWEKNPEKGTWIGAEVIAAECGLGERTVRLALAGLRSKKIIIRIGYNKGRSANMPIYAFHPENGQVLPIFASFQEPAIVARSKAEEPADYAEEPANQVKNLQLTAVEPAMVAPDKGLKKTIEKEEKEPADLSSSFLDLGQDHAEYEELGRKLEQISKEHQAIVARYKVPASDRSKKEANALTLKLVSVATAADCPGSTAKNNLEITQAILDNQGFEVAVWIRALDKMIADARSADDGGKSFHLGHVIARMSGTLPSGLAAARKAAKEAELSPLILSLTTFQERRRAIVESAECQARQIAEAEQVEDFLPDETHLWVKNEVAQ
jgi:hypothetical protein